MVKVRFVKYLDTSNSIYQAPTAYDITGDYWPDADYRALEAENERLHAERRRDALDGQAALDEANNEIVALEAQLEGEVDHRKFLGELLQALYGDKWETLTIHEAKKHKAKLAALVEAGNLLLKKLKLVHDSAEYETVWHISQSHVGPYKGPTYNDEMDKLKAAIAAAEGKP